MLFRSEGVFACWNKVWVSFKVGHNNTVSRFDVVRLKFTFFEYDFDMGFAFSVPIPKTKKAGWVACLCLPKTRLHFLEMVLLNNPSESHQDVTLVCFYLF